MSITRTRGGAHVVSAVCAALLLLAPICRADAPLVVVVDGVEGEVRDNVLGYLAIVQNRDQDLSDAEIAALHRRAPGEIREALEPFGYYRPEIDASLEDIDGDGWRARYRIDPGTPVPVGTVDIELLDDAADDPAFARLLDQLPLREGAPLRHADYDRSRDALRRLAAERGYFDARFTRRELRIDLDEYVAEARLTLDAGRRYRFGRIRFDQEVLDEALLRRYLPFREGDPYLAGRLLELQTALTASNYYELVSVAPRTAEAEDGEVPIDVVLTTRPSQHYTLSGGYGTDTGVRTRAGWEWRPVNRLGHALSASLELAEFRQGAKVRYSLPMDDPRDERLDFTGSLSEEQSDTTFSRIAQVGSAMHLGDERFRYILSLDYKREESRTGGERQQADLVIPGISTSFVRAENVLRVESGYRLDASVHGGSELLGSDVSFGQFRAFGKHILTPLARLRLLARWEVGTTWTDDFERLPVSERFYAGGDQSIRGYAWRSLGPKNDAGKVVGGPHLVVASIEVERYFDENWGGALFLDGGNAFDDAPDDLVAGAGIGLRWRTPIGAVRVDLAKALDSDDNDWRLHLQLGPDL